MSTTSEPRQSPNPSDPFNEAPPSGHVKHVVGVRWNGPATVTGDPRRKHPMLAVGLSLMPGLGQIYVGYYQQGITLMIVAGSLLTVVSNPWNFGLHEFEPLLIIAMVFTWLFSCVDAGRRASLYNQALAGLRPMDLPENQQTPEWHGSLVGGAALVLFGGILFAHTMFGLPMEWVTRWWPLALVLVGVWLVYASVRSQAGDSTPAKSAASDSDSFES